MPTFNDTEIELLKQYKYKSKSKGFLFNFFLSKKYEFLITILPNNFSPNFISVLSFFIQCFSFIISFVFSKGFTENLPSWLCYINSFSLFLSHTLSHLDGMLSRKIKCSNAIGYIFNYNFGCINSVLECLKFSSSFHIGLNSNTFFLIFCVEIAITISIWSDYVTHFNNKLHFSITNEIIYLIIIFYLITGIFPYFQTIFIKFFFKLIYFLLFLIFLIYQLIRTLIYIFENFIFFFDFILCLIPTLITSIIFYIHYFLQNKNNFFSPYFFGSLGFTFQFFTQKIVLNSIISRKSINLFNLLHFSFWIILILPFFLTFLNQNHFFWLFYFVFILIVSIINDVLIIFKISQILSIPIFINRRIENIDFNQHLNDNEDLL